VRYWTYVEPGEGGKPNYVTVSEEEIRRDYWPVWVRLMEDAGGWSPYLCIEDCIDDWSAIHGAWRVEE